MTKIQSSNMNKSEDLSENLGPNLETWKDM